MLDLGFLELLMRNKEFIGQKNWTKVTKFLDLTSTCAQFQAKAS